MATVIISLCLVYLVVDGNAQSTDFDIIEKHHAEKNQELLAEYDRSPSLNSEEDGVVMRLRKDQDFTIRRPVVHETSPLRVQKSLDALESNIMSKATATYTNMVALAVASSVQSAVATTVAYVQPIRDKAGSLKDDAENLESSVSGTSYQVLDALNRTIETFRSEITTTIEDLKTSTDQDIRMSLDQVNTTIVIANSMMGKVFTDAETLACNGDSKGTLRLHNENLEACDGSEWRAVRSNGKHSYIQWGSSECSGTSMGVKQLYSGFAWGGYHDHRGGAEPMCLKSDGGFNGGKNDGDDSANLVYPLRLEGPSPNNGNVQSGRLIRCSKCVVEKSCYLEIGLNSCGNSAYEPVYSGSTYGNYHGHVSNHGRICLDSSGRYDLTNSYGAYLYPSKLRSTFDGRSDNAFLKCHVCCEK